VNRPGFYKDPRVVFSASFVDDETHVSNSHSRRHEREACHQNNPGPYTQGAFTVVAVLNPESPRSE
jgi:hypothetical protein